MKPSVLTGGDADPLRVIEGLAQAITSKAIKSVIRTMADRIAARGALSSAEVAEGLAEAITIKAVATGRDADTGEKLLWVETIDSGAFAFRLSGEAREMLADALRDDEDFLRECEDGSQPTDRPVFGLAHDEESGERSGEAGGGGGLETLKSVAPDLMMNDTTPKSMAAIKATVSNHVST